MSRFGIVTLRPSYVYRPQSFFEDDDDDLFSLPKQLVLRLLQEKSGHNQQRQKTVSTTDNGNDNKFHVSMDVNHFSPRELDIKTVDNTVVVHGRHEEREDDHGYVSREFTRRYVLPDNVDAAAVVSSLSRDGVLTIEAPTKPNERIVPIVQKKSPPSPEMQTDN